jgi:hypothetical protein
VRYRPVLLLFALLTGLPPSAAPQATELSDAALRAGFVAPPTAAKLRCYWWWLNGNTTEETITHELTEMSRKGYGGVLLVDANGSNQNGNDDVPPGPTFGSPKWTRLYLDALRTAAELHLEVTLNITSGWNLGGPDVTPADASKLLTWSRQPVDQSGFDGLLPMPPIQNGFYRQIAVLAYPLAHGPALPGREGDTRKPIRALRAKAAAVEIGISMPDTKSLLEDFPATPGEQDTLPASVVNISTQVDSSGHLHWTPPTRGAWEILRIGYTDSDARVSTSSGAWQGLAIDYLDRGAFDTYWDHTVAPLLEVSRPYLKTTLVNLATDSWELGGTNWTGRFAEHFRRSRGYDPIPYLPVIAGRIVGDRATSDRFLNDLRRTVGDLVTDHYDHFAERAKAYGLGIQCESGGPHGAPLDALETFRSAAVPQTEYWAQSNEHRSSDQDRYFTKEAASAADIYGKQFAANEGMTSIGPQWSESPATDLKPSFDQALTEGMNRLVWHEFTSSPASFGLPGNEYFAGTHLNPRVTWWPQSQAFFMYLNRSQFLLQQGHSVDDVLYFYGDEVPNFVRLKSDDPAHVLPGYDYDVTDEDALLRTLSIRHGRIETPAGNQYRLLALPAGRRLSFASLQQIASYVRQGGNVAGEPPLSPIGLVDDATAKKFAALTDAVWDGCKASPHSYGAGKVFCSPDSRAALKALNVDQDFESDSHSLDYVHRADKQRDIYFVRNASSKPVNAVTHFRISGRTPEIWSTLDGTVVPQAYYVVEKGRTEIPLHLDPYGSEFVVFSRRAGLHITRIVKDGRKVTAVGVEGDEQSGFKFAHPDAGVYQLTLSDGREMNGEVRAAKTEQLPPDQWTIEFEQDWGAPVGLLPLPGFLSWSEMQDPGIRYFSGTATYRTTVNLSRRPGQRIFLTLTDLHEVCGVYVNSRKVGTLWARPYRLDITDSLKDGRNAIQLEVTNLWPNRIIGDAQPSATHSYTHTNIRKYTAKSPLLASGLIGPVAIETEPVTTIHPEAGVNESSPK